MNYFPKKCSSIRIIGEQIALKCSPITLFLEIYFYYYKQLLSVILTFRIVYVKINYHLALYYTNTWTN